MSDTPEDAKARIVAESRRLQNEAHVAVARSLIAIEEARAVRGRYPGDPFEAVTAHKLREIEQAEEHPGEPVDTPSPFA